MMMMLLNPLYRLAAYAALGAALFGFGFLKGCQVEGEKRAAMVAKAAVEGQRIAQAREKVTTQIVVRYLPQVTRTAVVTETIVKEVPTYVPLSDPPLSPGFRVLHDAAAAGSIPDPARVPDAAPVEAQAAARTVAENYGACRKDQLTLDALQEWVREQQKVK